MLQPKVPVLVNILRMTTMPIMPWTTYTCPTKWPEQLCDKLQKQGEYLLCLLIGVLWKCVWKCPPPRTMNVTHVSKEPYRQKQRKSKSNVKIHTIVVVLPYIWAGCSRIGKGVIELRAFCIVNTIRLWKLGQKNQLFAKSRSRKCQDLLYCCYVHLAKWIYTCSSHQ